MAFNDDINALVVQLETALLDFQSRIVHSKYTPTATEQTTAKAALTDAIAMLSAQNANPVAVVPTAAGTVTIVQASAAITAAAGASHTKQLYANVVDSSGVSRVRPVTWTSATPAKATIDANGLLTGVAAGTSNITAACEGQTSAAIVCTVS